VANPLDLPGPQFLAFYAFVAVIVLVFLWLVRGAAERGPVPRVDTSDPFLIADLRGGPDEATRRPWGRRSRATASRRASAPTR